MKSEVSGGIRGKQKRALEKVTGKPWERWNPEAVKAYFAFTDRGVRLAVSEGAKSDIDELLYSHRFHPVTVEMWKKDFCEGLLFMSDFDGTPNAYRKHVKEVYDSVWLSRGYTVPTCPTR